MKHIHYYIISALAALAFTGCADEIKPEDRLIYVEPAKASRAVLLEDYTGQRCVNCPYGMDVIESLTEQYGDTSVIAVSIHSGEFGFAGNDRLIGFMTDTGNEYYKHYGIENQPQAVIDRKLVGGKYCINREQWPNIVRTELEQNASINMALETAYDASTRTLDIRTLMTGNEGTTNGKLQLWLTEDSIVALQITPNDGVKYTKEYDYNYNHMHVFRTAVNGTWGEDVSVLRGDTISTHHTIQLDEKWVPAHTAVVAFVYNDGGVQQVVRKYVGK